MTKGTEAVNCQQVLMCLYIVKVPRSLLCIQTEYIHIIRFPNIPIFILIISYHYIMTKCSVKRSAKLGALRLAKFLMSWRERAHSPPTTAVANATRSTLSTLQCIIRNMVPQKQRKTSSKALGCSRQASTCPTNIPNQNSCDPAWRTPVALPCSLAVLYQTLS
jgi:hypothetical protein